MAEAKSHCIPNAGNGRVGACRWRESHVRFCEGGGVKSPSATRLVAGFQHHGDAVRFRRELEQRLDRFGMRMHPQKTRLIEFGRFAVRDRLQRGEGKPESFEFLGFTHISRHNWKGKFVHTRRTKAASLRSALQDTTQ